MSCKDFPRILYDSHGKPAYFISLIFILMIV